MKCSVALRPDQRVLVQVDHDDLLHESLEALFLRRVQGHSHRGHAVNLSGAAGKDSWA